MEEDERRRRTTLWRKIRWYLVSCLWPAANLTVRCERLEAVEAVAGVSKLFLIGFPGKKGSNLFVFPAHRGRKGWGSEVREGVERQRGQLGDAYFLLSSFPLSFFREIDGSIPGRGLKVGMGRRRVKRERKRRATRLWCQNNALMTKEAKIFFNHSATTTWDLLVSNSTVM